MPNNLRYFNSNFGKIVVGDFLNVGSIVHIGGKYKIIAVYRDTRKVYLQPVKNKESIDTEEAYDFLKALKVICPDCGSENSKDIEFDISKCGDCGEEYYDGR